VSWENATSFLEPTNIFPFYNELAKADFTYKRGALRGNWRVAYRDSSSILTIAMAKYGKPVSNIWALRKIKINKPTIIEELGKIKQLMMGSVREESEEVSARQLGLKPLLDKYSKLTHTSRKDSWYELKFLAYLGSKNPEAVGKFLAYLYIPEETVKLFLNHFMKKEKEETINKILESYRQNLGMIGPKTLTLRGAETSESEITKEEKKKEETEKTKKKRKKEEKKEKMKTLDEFFFN